MLAIEKNIADFVRGAPFATVQPEDRVSVAVALMLERKLDCVLVIDRGKAVGIFTDFDFLNRVAAAGRDPATTPIGEVMTADPEILGPLDRMNYAINRMGVRGYRNIPIVDPEGRVISVLDVRMVMLHLLKLFAELDREGAPRRADEWTDVGGGG